MTLKRITCFQCSKQIEGKAFINCEENDYTLDTPIFCSKACSKKFKPDEMTLDKLLGLQNVIAPARPEDNIPPDWSRVATGEIPAFGDRYWMDEQFVSLSVVAIAAKVPIAKDEFVIHHPDRFKVLSQYKMPDLPTKANHRQTSGFST